jgi:homoserine kinase type II
VGTANWRATSPPGDAPLSVFTKVSHAELIEFLKQYPLGELIGFQGIGEGVENTNYFVDTSDGRWVLTLFERLNYDDLPFFLGLMDHLASRGFPSAMPAHTHQGDNLTRLNGKPAALVRRLSGQSVLFPSLSHCQAVGRILGDLHVTAAAYAGHCANPRGVEWRARTGAALMPKVDEASGKLIHEMLMEDAQTPWSSLPQGVIHADLFKDNVLFVEERLTGIIDFYYACNDAWLYDLAVTVNDWCTETDGRLNAMRYHVLVDGYRSRRELERNEHEAWPAVLRSAALRFWLSRLYDWHLPRDGDVVHVKNPDQYRRILEHHRQQVPPAL